MRVASNALQRNQNVSSSGIHDSTLISGVDSVFGCTGLILSPWLYFMITKEFQKCFVHLDFWSLNSGTVSAIA